MAVVKANGYGHGMIQIARTAVSVGAAYCGVARVEEAFELRRAGIKVPILIFGHTSSEDIAHAVREDIRLTIFHPEQLEAISGAVRVTDRPARVHVNVDTGMSRLGISPESALDVLQRLTEAPDVEVEGIYTHFARADEPEEPLTDEQEQVFRKMLDEIDRAGLRPPIVHTANSAATLTRHNSQFNMVRVGIAMYGLEPSVKVPLPEGFRPALTWKSYLIQVRTFPPGRGISYGHVYKTQTGEKIGVVPVGYGDGYRRLDGNQVLIHGRSVPVVGRVCMDLVMVKLDDVPQAKVGDEVVLIGEQGDSRISAEEIATRWGTINYEVTCGITSRVPRIYVQNT